MMGLGRRDRQSIARDFPGAGDGLGFRHDIFFVFWRLNLPARVPVSGRWGSGMFFTLCGVRPIRSCEICGLKSRETIPAGTRVPR